MSGSVNKVILVGNLGRDPEVRTMQNGGKVVNLSIATSERWNDRDGNKQERTEWHRVVIFNERLAEVAERYLRKGMKVYLEGSLQTRKWTDQSGQDKYSTEVVLQRFRGELTMLDGGRGEGGAGGQGGGGGYDQGGYGGYDESPAPAARGGAAAGGARGGQAAGRGGPAPSDYSADLDDEIPF